MISFEEVGILLDDIAESLPKDFYKELNGGINLLPDVKFHQNSHEINNLFILGEYYNDRMMGRYINIYYGSFIRIYSHFNIEKQKEKLREILVHEFTHHLESLAGERGLEIKDRHKLEKYRQNMR